MLLQLLTMQTVHHNYYQGILNALLIICLLTFLWDCSPIMCGSCEDEPFMRLSDNSLIFGPKSGMQLITISSNTGWIISKDVSWITIDKTFGENSEKLAVMVDENKKTERRYGKISIEALGEKMLYDIKVTQFGINNDSNN